MTTQLHTAAKLALDALDYFGDTSDYDVSPDAWRKSKAHAAITALRSALAAPMPEPWICAADRMPEPNVNVLCFSDLNSQPVIASWAGRDYNWIPTHWMPLPAAPGAAPPAAPAPVVPLTDEQIIELRVQAKGDYKPWSESIAFARAIEKAHGIGTTGGAHG